MAPDNSFTARQFATEPVATLRQYVLSDDLLHHGSVMAVATAASGALNYAYQVFMGRALGPEQYGVFGALFALFYLVNVLGRGIRFSATRFSAELSEDTAALSAFHRGFLRKSLVFSCVVFVVLALSTPLLGDFLGVSTPLLLIAIAGTAPFGLALTANFGTFQGLQWFPTLGGYKVLLAGVKLAFGVGLVTLGYGVSGAFGALVISSVLLFGLSTAHVFRNLGNERTSFEFEYSRAYTYTLPAVLAGFCLTVPTTVDVILVKHFFPSHTAGLYAAASVLGKILIFLPMGISTALFPKVSGHRTTDERRSLLTRALFYTAVIAGAGAALFALFPHFVLTAFYGMPYADAAAVLPWYGIAVFAFALSSVTLNFQLALDQNRFVYLFTAGSFLEIALMWAFHGSLLQFVQILFVVNVGLFALGLFEVYS
ncbi:hypothetical protein [Haladaptatus sp. ZSTT2]|uniref:hypothetical protein n=1 Tax=Haladaptatus sp. ZSTT2 TaxID=3120515 RepID=UPI00300F0665